MDPSFYAARLFMIALRLAAGADLEAPIELMVEWPSWVHGMANA